MPRRAVELLTRLGRTVAVAESLTGGALTDDLVTVPGASRCLRGGVVAYATDLKHELLGVDAGLLSRVGPVHPDVARAMAEGVRTRLAADYGLATTGVAGPDPQGGRPPGTFHVAVAGPLGVEVRSAAPAETEVPGRHEVRAAARAACLGLLLEALGRENRERNR
ncbi:CinA family protein [Actinotalea sp. BY-33]|uniref:CinA family protein n=1 Tax=Actinotalea soli TaxID=2819234 RepID=A0A939LSZ2_9CELL|nr:CinA family protein [Actinotalea soli]MBO1753318.1 CinA family protein [Actinotalea soli]